MPLAGSVPCADLGTEYCPCALAFAGCCVYCTLLRTGDACACEWAGTCVLLHMGSGAAVRRGRPWSGAGTGNPAPAPLGPAAERPAGRARVASVRAVAPGVREIRLALEAGICSAFRRPGCFVMIRPASRAARYDVPLTVVETGPRGIRLVYRTAGPKTRALDSLVGGDLVSWRGPYYSGLLGGFRLTRGGAARAVIVARGLGQAVALPVAAWLRAAGAGVSVLLDPRGAGGAFCAGELAAVGGTGVQAVSCYRREGLAAIGEALSGPEDRRTGPPADPRTDGRSGGGGRALLVSCGSDLQHRWLAGAWPQLQADASPARPELVATNNSLIVCAEGTCGACIRRLPGGGRIRGCKADVPPERIWPPPTGPQAPAEGDRAGGSGNGPPGA